jgi:maleylpyruvate isomerase
MRLYGYWRSSASYRVRIALALKGVTYEHVPVHLVRDGGEQRAPDYRAKNPMAQVPTLELEADLDECEGPEGAVVRLSQSIAILEWLDETYPTPPLFPKKALDRARARELAEIVNSGIQPLQNLPLMAELKRLGGDQAGPAFARSVNEHGLAALEAKASASAGRYLVGDDVTIADVCLVPQLYGARRFGVDVAAYPTLARVEAALVVLPAFAEAHPDRQPDAQPA